MAKDVADRDARLAELAESVLNQDPARAGTLTKEAIDAGISPIEILNLGLSRGMRRVGDRFKACEIFMPEVLVACDAYYAGLELVRPLIRAERATAFLGKIVLGTIYGDIHTVGKDVAVPVFEAAGFHVIDLGVDVPDEKFVEVVRAEDPDIVGLGTYMTSTFMHAGETVKLLEKAGVRNRVKVICGGPAVDPRAARRMGADDASNDAWEAVEKLRQLKAEIARTRGATA
ncbi:MAG: cobalamin-dependent protein [Planctomycetes bacterium]|nr:cobalamin-dependent protein [Planctomycetota bacterium]